MRRQPRRFTYANVVATLALFLALSGGAVFAANKLSGKTIKKNTEPGNRIKKNTLPSNRLKTNSVTSDRIKDDTLQSTDFAAGAPGTTILDVTASDVPGATTDPPATTPVSFSGTTSFTPSRKARVHGAKVSFTPANGHSYLVMGEVKGNPVDADGAGGGNSCFAQVEVDVNGIQSLALTLSQNLSAAPPQIATVPVNWDERPVGLIDKGQPQSITARVFGDSSCGPSTTINAVRVVVVSFG